MKKQIVISCWLYRLYQFTTLLSIILLYYVGWLKVSTLDLRKDYLRTAPKVGMLFAIECKDVNITRSFLRGNVEKCSASGDLSDYLRMNVSFHRQYDQIVLDEFEKNIKQLKKEGKRENRADTGL